VRRLIPFIGAFLVVTTGWAIETRAISGKHWAGPIGQGTWQLHAPAGMQRWLVVRLIPSPADPNYHVEVLEKASGDPAWKFKWLASHMAVTEDALRSSIRRMSRHPENYPETFENGYTSWIKSQSHPVCSTTVEACLNH
jgi:hypothetical protein